MLPKRQVLIRLIKANTSFLIYGQKASGKTLLVKGLLEEAKKNYIEINCTLVARKVNFLKLFNLQLNKFLRKEKMECQPLNSPSNMNLDSWINEIKKLIFDKEDSFIDKIDGLYIFMDNIQEVNFSESFLSAFYSACQKQFNFRFNFLFCGVNFLRKDYTLDLPFRTMISFCMPKPIFQYTKTVNETISNLFRKQFEKLNKTNPDGLEKAMKMMSVQIIASFDNIQFNLDKMKTIATAIFELALPHIEENDISKSISRMIHIGKLKELIMQVVEHGPLQDYSLKRKVHAIQFEEPADTNPNLEYYPNLIMSSIHLADYYPQKEDKRRFHDYKGRTNIRNRDLKKSEFKIPRHNINRIISISEALESQAKENDKEFANQHHSLDYYATFEHLRNMNRIKFVGSKITGIVKEEEAKAFINKCELKYEQFMSS